MTPYPTRLRKRATVVLQSALDFFRVRAGESASPDRKASMPAMDRRIALRRAATFDELDPFEDPFGDVVSVPAGTKAT